VAKENINGKENRRKVLPKTMKVKKIGNNNAAFSDNFAF
jgi:hypothetical protein